MTSSTDLQAHTGARGKNSEQKKNARLVPSLQKPAEIETYSGRGNVDLLAERKRELH